MKDIFRDDLKNQKGQLLPMMALAAILILAIGGYYLFSERARSTQQLNTPPTNNTSAKTFVLSNFTLSLPNSQLANTGDPDSNQIQKTKITTPTGDTMDCTSVAGLNYVYLKKANPPSSPSDSNNYIYAEGWNMKNLQFKDQESAQAFQKNIDSLTKLENYQDEKRLQELEISAWGQNYTPDNQNLPNLNPVEGFHTCAGLGFTVPFLIKKVDSPKFDSVYFAEVSKGNGDTFGYPWRVLIINKGDSWLLFEDEQKAFEYKDGQLVAWPGCADQGRLSAESLRCVMNLWATNYRNEAENQKWIQETLKAITFSD